MKLKLDEKGNAVLQDGKPVYVHEDGKEAPIDAVSLVQTISRLNFEAKTHREAKEAAEAKIKEFDGFGEPKEIAKLIEIGKSVEGKKLIESGEVEALKAQIAKQFEPVVNENNTLKSKIYDLQVGSQFAQSTFIKEKVAIPPDLLQKAYASNFKLDGDKVIANDASGNPIYSRTKIGEYAGFDEAIEVLISQRPDKDHILKGTGHQGSGAQQSQNGGAKQTISRAQFDAMTPAEQSNAAKTATITD